MSRRYSDYEELRPLGEATHVRDDTLSSKGRDPRRQRSDCVDRGYPDAIPAIAAECDSCGASVPTGQTKCRFCLTNHLDPATPDQSLPDTAQRLLDVVHLLVEASTFYGTVAKGSAAVTLLVNSDSEPAIDDCQLIDDLDEAPAPQLTDPWPTLPSATRATSAYGDQLLATARERTTWTETAQSSHDSEHATVLYDEAGYWICAEEQLTALLEDADDDVWLVPVIALQHSVQDTPTDHPRHERRTKEYLECRECDRDTRHRFRESEAVPDDAWAGKPMWECQQCETSQYGPAPEAGQ